MILNDSMFVFCEQYIYGYIIMFSLPICVTNNNIESSLNDKPVKYLCLVMGMGMGFNQHPPVNTLVYLQMRSTYLTFGQIPQAARVHCAVQNHVFLFLFLADK